MNVRRDLSLMWQKGWGLLLSEAASGPSLRFAGFDDSRGERDSLIAQEIVVSWPSAGYFAGR
jgi:hypothetical protein